MWKLKLLRLYLKFDLYFALLINQELSLVWIFKDYKIDSNQHFVWSFSCFLSMGHSSSYYKVGSSYICNLLISNEYGIFLRQKFINCYTDILFVNEDVFTMEMGRGIWRQMSAEKRVHYVFTIHILTANFDKKTLFI